jgi:peptidoglycan/xylan/chitin deacetylase (PgdA/CDA1 family)
MICDFDDFYDGNTGLDYLFHLHAMRPDFRCTLFTVPNRITNATLESLPSWMEVAVHGFDHPTPRECEGWDRDAMDRLLDHVSTRPKFVRGFKAPGWQISNACYDVLLERGYWVADQDYNNGRRPPGLPCYLLGPESWHGHIQNVCGNGLQETFDELSRRVSEADRFQFVSEVITGAQTT